jgi:hypothetical protein
MTSNANFWLVLGVLASACLIGANIYAFKKHEYKWYYAVWTVGVFAIVAAIMFPALQPRGQQQPTEARRP